MALLDSWCERAMRQLISRKDGTIGAKMCGPGSKQNPNLSVIGRFEIPIAGM